MSNGEKRFYGRFTFAATNVRQTNRLEQQNAIQVKATNECVFTRWRFYPLTRSLFSIHSRFFQSSSFSCFYYGLVEEEADFSSSEIEQGINQANYWIVENILLLATSEERKREKRDERRLKNLIRDASKLERLRSVFSLQLDLVCFLYNLRSVFENARCVRLTE